MSQCRPQPMMKKMGFTELAVGPKTHRKNPCTLPARISGVSFFFFFGRTFKPIQWRLVTWLLRLGVWKDQGLKVTFWASEISFGPTGLTVDSWNFERVGRWFPWSLYKNKTPLENYRRRWTCSWGVSPVWVQTLGRVGFYNMDRLR